MKFLFMDIFFREIKVSENAKQLCGMKFKGCLIHKASMSS